MAKVDECSKLHASLSAAVFGEIIIVVREAAVTVLLVLYSFSQCSCSYYLQFPQLIAG